MAIVKKYGATVKQVLQHTQGVYSLDLLSDSGVFRYHPGQFLHLALDEYDPSSGWPESRCFSIQTPPGSNVLRITFAVKGKFTGRMETQLAEGSPVTLKLPFGELFTQEHQKENTVFVAGGTGITPYLSLFNDPTFKEYTDPALYAGFRNRAMNFYGPELELAKAINPSFTVHCFYEDEDGLINPEELLNGRGQTFFISGPPAMIAFFKASLHAKGIELTQIKTDDWE